MHTKSIDNKGFAKNSKWRDSIWFLQNSLAILLQEMVDPQSEHVEPFTCVFSLYNGGMPLVASSSFQSVEARHHNPFIQLFK